MHYLAYGSNLHPLRLLERVPSSRLLGRLELSGYRLAFHKLGQDGSGKCNIVSSGLEGDRVHAALFELQAEEKALLDGFEGEGYAVEEMALQWRGRTIRPFVYVAEEGWIDDALLPYHWYRDIVGIGAGHLGLPEGYVDSILHQPSVEDPDEARRERHRQLIERMREWPGD
jgi:hypothetical protein